MLRTVPQTRNLSLTYQIAAIAAFTVLTIIAARITIPFIPVPFTMQTFAVLLAGMVLGSRAGALSQVAYLALIVVCQWMPAAWARRHSSARRAASWSGLWSPLLWSA